MACLSPQDWDMVDEYLAAMANIQDIKGSVMQVRYCELTTTLQHSVSCKRKQAFCGRGCAVCVFMQLIVSLCNASPWHDSHCCIYSSDLGRAEIKHLTSWSLYSQTNLILSFQISRMTSGDMQWKASHAHPPEQR